MGVFGLSLRTREGDLEDVFRQFGSIEKVTIVYDHRVSLSWALKIRKLMFVCFFFGRAINQEDLDLYTLKTKLMLPALAMQ